MGVVDDLRVRLTHAAEIAAGFEHPDGSARAAVRQAIAEQPALENASPAVLGRAARAILDGCPLPTGPVECLACSQLAATDIDGAQLCPSHERPYRAGMDRAIADRVLAGL